MKLITLLSAMGLLLGSVGIQAAEIASIYPPLTMSERLVLNEYDLAKSNYNSRLALPEALPSSSTLVYNVYTKLGDYRDSNYPIGADVDHTIDFCNMTGKNLTVNLFFQIDGTTPWQKQVKMTNIQPYKCYLPTLVTAYNYGGTYLFVGAAIAKGQGQNTTNRDSSKFLVK